MSFPIFHNIQPGFFDFLNSTMSVNDKYNKPNPSGKHQDGELSTLLHEYHTGNGQRESTDVCMRNYGGDDCPLNQQFSHGDKDKDPYQVPMGMRKLAYQPPGAHMPEPANGRGLSQQ